MADWQNGLFGCFNDCGICLCSYFLPCYQFGKNAEALGHSCFLCGLASLLGLPLVICGAMHRQELREQKGIDGSFVGDLAAYFCCPLCAMVQMGSEIKAGTPAVQSMAREWDQTIGSSLFLGGTAFIFVSKMSISLSTFWHLFFLISLLPHSGVLIVIFIFRISALWKKARLFTLPQNHRVVECTWVLFLYVLTVVGNWTFMKCLSYS